MPFNKEELNTILKFGAEELFKEGDDEDEVQVRTSNLSKAHETRDSLSSSYSHVVLI